MTGIPSLLTESLGTLEIELKRLKGATEQIEQTKEAAAEAIQSARAAVQAAKMLVEPTQTLVEQIESVDFPSRLDKLDATMSESQAGLKTVHKQQADLQQRLQTLPTVLGKVEQVEKTTKQLLNKLDAATIASQAGLKTLKEQQADLQQRLQTLLGVFGKFEQVEKATRQIRVLLYTSLIGLAVVILVQVLQ
jgi:chromosome segregation ATPase